METFFSSRSSFEDVLPRLNLRDLYQLSQTNSELSRIIDDFCSNELRNKYGYTERAPNKSWLASLEYAQQKLYTVKGRITEKPIPREFDGYVQDANSALLLLTNGSLYFWMNKSRNYQKVPGKYLAIDRYHQALSIDQQLFLFIDSEYLIGGTYEQLVESSEKIGDFSQILIPTSRPVILFGDNYYVDDSFMLHYRVGYSDNFLEYEFDQQLPNRPVQILIYSPTHEYSHRILILDELGKIYICELESGLTLIHESSDPVLEMSDPIFLDRDHIFLLRDINNEITVLNSGFNISVLNTPFQGQVEQVVDNKILVRVGAARLLYTIGYSPTGQSSIHLPNYYYQVYKAGKEMMLAKANDYHYVSIDKLPEIDRNYLEISPRDLLGNVYVQHSKPGFEFNKWLFLYPSEESGIPRFDVPSSIGIWYDLRESPLTIRMPTYRNPIYQTVVIEGDPTTILKVVSRGEVRPENPLRSSFFTFSEEKAKEFIN